MHGPLTEKNCSTRDKTNIEQDYKPLLNSIAANAGTTGGQ